MQLTEKDIKRFWSKVDIRGENECWNWKAGKCTGGYGQFRVFKNGKALHLLTHRVAWQIANGREPREGYQIAHAPIVCHNRACCNPAHLSEKTRIENRLDQFVDETNPRGERNGMAKLTRSDVEQIRALHRQGVIMPTIGKMFGICKQQVFHIVHGEHWK